MELNDSKSLCKCNNKVLFQVYLQILLENRLEVSKHWSCGYTHTPSVKNEPLCSLCRQLFSLKVQL